MISHEVCNHEPLYRNFASVTTCRAGPLNEANEEREKGERKGKRRGKEEERRGKEREGKGGGCDSVHTWIWLVEAVGLDLILYEFLSCSQQLLFQLYCLDTHEGRDGEKREEDRKRGRGGEDPEGDVDQ